MAEAQKWLEGLTPSVASFLGSLSGASVGLLAILLGALFNAFLNRQRDDRLRRAERHGIAVALQTELSMLRDACFGNATEAEAGRHIDHEMYVQDPAQLCVVWPAHVGRIGTLRPEAIQAICTAYGSVPNYVEGLLLLGAVPIARRGEQDERRMYAVPFSARLGYAKVTRALGQTFNEAVTALERDINSSRSSTG